MKGPGWHGKRKQGLTNERNLFHSEKCSFWVPSILPLRFLIYTLHPVRRSFTSRFEMCPFFSFMLNQTRNEANIPLSLGGHVESQEDKKFRFRTARREFSARLAVQKQSFLFS